MKIIWLAPEVPSPPIGGRNGVYNRIKQLSRYAEIYLFAIAYSEDEMNQKNDMLKYCKEVHFYNRSKNKFQTLLKSILKPYSVASRSIPELKKDLKTLVFSEKINVIIVDFPNMANNLRGILGKNIYYTLNQHNIEYMRMRDMISVKTIPLYKRIAYYLESFRLEIYEKNIYKKDIFSSITFFSEVDILKFEKNCAFCNSKLKVFPLGANKGNLPLNFNYRHNLLFVGRLDEVASPNVEAVLWFCKNVLKKIVIEIPDVKLILAGANPGKRIMDLAGENIEVISNYISTDEIYSKSDCVILPLLSGGGVKGKLLEAVSYKKIVVSTEPGIEGTRFKAEAHVLFANSSDEFARKCILALSNPKEYVDMINGAYRVFETVYDWESIGGNYYSFLKNEIMIGEK